MRRAVLLITFLALAALPGCSDNQQEITDAAAARLQPRVAEIRQLAVDRQADHVAAKLAELGPVVEELRARGEMSDDAARAVLAAAEEVQAQLTLITTTTAAPPPPPQRDHHDDEDDRKKKEKEDEEDEEDDRKKEKEDEEDEEDEEEDHD